MTLGIDPEELARLCGGDPLKQRQILEARLRGMPLEDLIHLARQIRYKDQILNQELEMILTSDDSRVGEEIENFRNEEARRKFEGFKNGLSGNSRRHGKR